ncbi:MAG: hypothetical protein K2X62_12240 [Beijerinckiaceae bacterium]|nr:hypothetical protein [Beijerinckiaceae bacterium]MDO9441644.1 hypothetical protein [Beijerinckiaceae bacterium]
MAGILSPEVAMRIRQAVDSWNDGDHAAVLAHYAHDAQIASVVAGEWMQIGESLSAACLDFARLNRKIELIDILDGLNHVTVLLHDGKRYFSMTIEADDDLLARRVIICRGKKRLAQKDETRSAA